MHRNGVNYFPRVIDRGDTGCVVMIIEVYGSGDDMVAGIYQMCGRLHVKPKEWLRIVREEMRQIEVNCKESGVSELRVAGRDWSRVLTDYEPYDEVPNGLRKRL